jgi:hypothetical protein
MMDEEKSVGVFETIFISLQFPAGMAAMTAAFF